MNFDRREWLAVIAAGTAKLFGVPGESMAELPEDDEESSQSVSNSGRQYGTRQCDGCDNTFQVGHLRYYFLTVMDSGRGRPVELCTNCYDYYQSRWSALDR